MKHNKIAILTSKSSWFQPYAERMRQKLLKEHAVDLIHHPEDTDVSYDVVFILSYFQILPNSFLDKNRYNLVVHESDLPSGKGWAPLFWQILEGKNRIPVVLFEAVSEVDSGDIYCRGEVTLQGNELHDEIREIQANETVRVCMEFLDSEEIVPEKQIGDDSFYPKRTPKDSQLDIDKTIREQFQLLRIVSNEDYPAFFEMDGCRYKIAIEREL